MQYYIDNKPRGHTQRHGHGTYHAKNGDMISEAGSYSHRKASQGPVSTNYYRRKEELEAINRENLRINMKILTAQAKI